MARSNAQERYTTEVVISGFDGAMQIVGGRQNLNRSEVESVQKTDRKIYDNSKRSMAMINEQTSSEFPKPPGQPQPKDEGQTNHQSHVKLANGSSPFYATSDFDDDVPF